MTVQRGSTYRTARAATITFDALGTRGALCGMEATMIHEKSTTSHVWQSLKTLPSSNSVL